MAAEVVGGAFLSAFLQVLFDRLPSTEIVQFFHGKKPVMKVLNELNTVLLSANLLLNDAEEKQITNEEVRKWLDMLTEVIYDADDLVDKIANEVLRCKLEAESSSGISKMLKKFTNFFTAFDNNVKHETTEILGRLKFLVDQKYVLGLKEGAQHKLSQRPPAPLVEESSVYGRNNDKEAIVDMLLSDDIGHKISVIPIVGMGGIGKTTLAQLVYDDDRVKEHFELKVWVTISDEFDVFKITKIIYERVTLKKWDVEDLFKLQRKLKKSLRGKKFLFVQDDVWNENYHLWDALKSAFESGAYGSKIIVTTRSAIAASVVAVGPTYRLSNLSHGACWQLFVKHAFQLNEDVVDEYQDLKGIGTEIVKKCGGLPLAIKSIGGLLRSERNLKKWENILKSDIWELYKKEGSILPALWLSYRHLPTNLKRCFSYCSIFPKDYEFEKEKVILLWMAEGLLQTDKHDKRMEELGEEYFQELISRSLLQCQSGRNESIVIMHDLVHDLAMFVSGEFCIRLNDNNDISNIVSKTRHLSYGVGTYDSEKLEGLCKAKHLRTVLLLPNLLKAWLRPTEQFITDYKVVSDLSSTAGTCLRVLSVCRSSIKELPDSIGNLKHLRYLDLSYTKIRELPNSICNFYNLQTLLLTRCTKLTRLPKNMGSLINLRHLCIDGVPLEVMPLQISSMKKLQTLPKMVVGDGNSGPKINELKELQSLHEELDISGIENVFYAEEASEAKLKDKKFLTDLSLRWNSDAAGDAESSKKERGVLDALWPHTNLRDLKIEFYRGTIFSDWVGHDSFSNMVSICLTNCKNCWFLPPLGQLPSLKYVTIDGLDSVVSIGDEFHCSSASFRSLELLTLRNMLEWKEWSFSQGIKEGGIFPRLGELRLYNCPKLNVGLPGHIPSLGQLSVENCQQMVVLLQRPQQHVVNAFPYLVSIYISNCPSLESLMEFWISRSAQVHLFGLHRCGKLYQRFKGSVWECHRII